MKQESVTFSPELYARPWKQSTAYHEQPLDFEQALISKKDSTNGYSVQREYINSKQFHDKFEKLPVNPQVQQALYIQAGRLLEKVDGQGEERMLAINSRTGEFLVDNFDRAGSIKGTSFTFDEYQKIEKCPDFVTVMHNHSLNGRPSIQDILTYSNDNNINISLIVCHTGDIYSIINVNPAIESVYNDFLQEAKMKTSNVDEAKRLATTRLYEANERLDKKHKLFEIHKL